MGTGPRGLTESNKRTGHELFIPAQQLLATDACHTCPRALKEALPDRPRANHFCRDPLLVNSTVPTAHLVLIHTGLILQIKNTKMVSPRGFPDVRQPSWDGSCLAES